MKPTPSAVPPATEGSPCGAPTLTDTGLRRRAEAALQTRPTPDNAPATQEMQKLLHELQVHQIELEMQNEELRDARLDAETALHLYTELYDFAPISYFTLDCNGAISQTNLAGARLLGLERSRLMGNRFQAFLAGADLCGFDAFLQKVFAVEAKQGCEVQLARNGQPSHTVQIEATRSAEGQACRVVVLDVTARKTAETDLRRVNQHLDQLVSERTKQLGQAQRQLLQAEKMASIGVLAAGVAHEINNPLSFVYSNLGILREYIDDIMAVIAKYEAAERSMDGEAGLLEEIGQFKTQINFEDIRKDLPGLLAESGDGLMRIRKIVQDLKYFSHAGSLEEWVWADIHQELEMTLNMLKHELKYTCEVRKEYGTLPPIRCRAGQLNQVFMNLVVNAAHAVEQNGVISLRTGHENGLVWIEVADNGHGIAPEHLPQLFDPFFTTKPPGKGTGLGLSVSHGIVEQHGGRIEVRSEAGKGTTFRVWLPVRERSD